jgi:hypothetical protein
MEKRIRGELRQKILIGSEVGSIFFVFPVTWRGDEEEGDNE